MKDAKRRLAGRTDLSLNKNKRTSYGGSVWTPLKRRYVHEILLSWYSFVLRAKIYRETFSATRRNRIGHRRRRRCGSKDLLHRWTTEPVNYWTWQSVSRTRARHRLTRRWSTRQEKRRRQASTTVSCSNERRAIRFRRLYGRTAAFVAVDRWWKSIFRLSGKIAPDSWKNRGYRVFPTCFEFFGCLLDESSTRKKGWKGSRYRFRVNSMFRKSYLVLMWKKLLLLIF